MLKKFLFLFLSIGILSGNAQDQIKADSIAKFIESNPELSSLELSEAYFDLSLLSGSPLDGLAYGKKLLQLAEDENNPEYYLKAYFSIGVAERLLANPGNALENLFKAADYAVDHDEYQAFLIDTYQEISSTFTQIGDLEKAMEYGSKSIEILRFSENDYVLALSLLNMGYDFYLVERYDQALEYYAESRIYLEKIGMVLGLAYLKGNSALVMWKKGDLITAKRDLFDAIEMLQPLDDKYGIADYYNRLSEIYLEENQLDSSFFYAGKSLYTARHDGLKEQIRDAYKQFYEIFRQTNKLDSALVYQTRYHIYKDSIYNLEINQRMSNLKTAYEVGQKQSEVDALRAEKRNSQIVFLIGGIAFFAIVLLVISLYANIRAKSHLNTQLEEQKSSLIALNATKDKFFSIISHDLRGPAGIVTGMTDLLKRELTDGNVENSKELLNVMGESSLRLQKLLDNLLQWALQQKGHFPYEPEVLNLKSLLDRVAGLYSGMISSKDIKLDINLSDDLKIYSDENSTLGIFRNILNNAIKFSPKGAEIVIEAKLDDNSNTVTTSITDHGEGIPNDKLINLFDHSDETPKTGTAGEIGVGLGLQLVHDFIKLNNGEISVESEENKSTTFHVILPYSIEI